MPVNNEYKKAMLRRMQAKENKKRKDRFEQWKKAVKQEGNIPMYATIEEAAAKVMAGEITLEEMSKNCTVPDVKYEVLNEGDGSVPEAGTRVGAEGAAKGTAEGTAEGNAEGNAEGTAEGTAKGTSKKRKKRKKRKNRPKTDATEKIDKPKRFKYHNPMPYEGLGDAGTVITPHGGASVSAVDQKNWPSMFDIVELIAKKNKIDDVFTQTNNSKDLRAMDAEFKDLMELTTDPNDRDRKMKEIDHGNALLDVVKFKQSFIDKIGEYCTDLILEVQNTCTTILVGVSGIRGDTVAVRYNPILRRIDISELLHRWKMNIRDIQKYEEVHGKTLIIHGHVLDRHESFILPSDLPRLQQLYATIVDDPDYPGVEEKRRVWVANDVYSVIINAMVYGDHGVPTTVKREFVKAHDTVQRSAKMFNHHPLLQTRFYAMLGLVRKLYDDTGSDDRLTMINFVEWQMLVIGNMYSLQCGVSSTAADSSFSLINEVNGYVREWNDEPPINPLAKKKKKKKKKKK
jgi:hypothetical protein